MGSFAQDAVLSGYFWEFLKSKVRLEGRAAAAVGQGPVQSRLHCMDSACDSPALAEGA